MGAPRRKSRGRVKRWGGQILEFPRQAEFRPQTADCRGPGTIFLEGVDHLGDQGMANDILPGEADRPDIFELFQLFDHVGEAR